jgi:hypothetical protein
VLAGVGLVVGALLVVRGQRLLADGDGRFPAVAWWLGGLAVLVALERRFPGGGIAASLDKAWNDQARLRIVLAAAATVLAAVVWALAHEHAAPAGVVAALWLSSLATAVVAATAPWTRIPRRRRWPWSRKSPPAAALAAVATVALALLLRVLETDRYPSVIDHDETSLGLVARGVLDGTTTDPFATGWLSHPTLFAYVQAGALWVFGDSLGALRVPSALFGAGAVLFTWLYMRRLFPAWVAVAAAVVLAVLPYHLHFSRLALNNVADSFFLAAVLFFLDRGIVERRRLDCLLAGVLVGLSQYFYFGSRLLVPLGVAVGVFLALQSRRNAASQGGRLALAAWAVGGALLAFTPLLAHYVDQPSAYGSRARMVGIDAEWLESRREATGSGTVGALAQHLEDSVLLPFAGAAGGTYHPPPPLLGLPVAVLTAVGVAVATARLTERRYFPLAVAWWAALAGSFLTQEPTSPRFVIATPLVAMACAIALWLCQRLLAAAIPRPTALAAAAAALAVGALSIWGVHNAFRDSSPLRVYGDVNSLVASELAFELRARGETTVFFGGVPRMSYAGFSGLAFVAPEARGVDLSEPLRSAGSVPPAAGPSLYVFLPERRRELRFVLARYPWATVRVVRDETGSELYVEAAVKSPASSAPGARG